MITKGADLRQWNSVFSANNSFFERESKVFGNGRTSKISHEKQVLLFASDEICSEDSFKEQFGYILNQLNSSKACK